MEGSEGHISMREAMMPDDIVEMLDLFYWYIQLQLITSSM